MFTCRPPRAELRDAVEQVWAVALPGRTHLEQVLPSPRPQLLVRLTADRLDWGDADGDHHTDGAAISGPFARPVRIRADQQDATLGVVFRPGGLAAFTARPVAGLVGGYVPLLELWPPMAGALERCRATSPERALRLLEDALLACRRGRVDRGVRRAVQALACPGARVRGVADHFGWSERTLRRRFAAQVGLGPKALARLVRFRAAVDGLHPGVDLGAHALAHGYADQAHFNHDFRDFSGRTPGQWLGADRPWSTHVTC